MLGELDMLIENDIDIAGLNWRRPHVTMPYHRLLDQAMESSVVHAASAPLEASGPPMPISHSAVASA